MNINALLARIVLGFLILGLFGPPISSRAQEKEPEGDYGPLLKVLPQSKHTLADGTLPDVTPGCYREGAEAAAGNSVFRHASCGWSPAEIQRARGQQWPGDNTGIRPLGKYR